MRGSLGDFDEFISGGEPIARIDIISAKGSTPRDVGAWMLVSDRGIFQTIGGGQLEYMAIDKARSMIQSASRNAEIMSIPLGPEIGQCCGGAVELSVRLCDPVLLDECREQVQAEHDALPDVYVFGAGHVGNALAQALSLLPVRPMLIDTREAELAAAPNNVETLLAPIPEAVVSSAKPGSVFVVLTHEHSLDFLIAAQALARQDAAYVGMIGSKTKRATFCKWLAREYADDSAAARLVCPIGGNEVADKRPEVIAALVAAEILTALERHSEKTALQHKESATL